MLQLKFKVWDTENKEFQKPNEVRIDGNGVLYGDTGTEWVDIVDTNDFKMSICTGLKDKNGDDIYTGHIVNFHIFTQEFGENLGIREGEKEIIGEISLQPMGIWIQSDKEEDCGYILLFDGIHEESFEIIGSIYESKKNAEDDERTM